MDINICLACDNNYAPLAGVAIASVLKNAQPDEFLSFYILDNNISQDNIKRINKLKKIKDCNINFVNINNKEDIFKNAYLPKAKGHLSLATYYRFLMPSLFPDIDKILYIDCDIVITTSLAEFFSTDISEYYAAVIEDTSCGENQMRLNFSQNELYFNAGVILANLKKWREDDIQAKLFSYLNQNLDDQDILNIVFKGQTKFMPKTYNYQYKARDYREILPPKIIHFITAYKPWLTGSKESFNKEFFRALRGTPWDNFYDQHIRRYFPVLFKDRKFVHLCLWGIKTRLKYKNA